MARTFQTKIEADNLNKISIFKLNQNNRLGKFPFRLEIVDDNGEIDDSFRLISTTCHYGGRRYWIKCHCERRVGVIYKIGGVFACRHCHKLTYASRNLKKSLRNDQVFRLLDKIMKLGSVEFDKIKLVG